jgi:hypothetical protein
LLLREALLVRFHSLCRQTILHLTLNLGFALLLSRLLLTRNENGQRGQQRENGELLHGVVRQDDGRVIRIKRDTIPWTAYGCGVGATAGVATTGVIVTFSIRSRLAFWTFA